MAIFLTTFFILFWAGDFASTTEIGEPLFNQPHSNDHLPFQAMLSHTDHISPVKSRHRIFTHDCYQPLGSKRNEGNSGQPEFPLLTHQFAGHISTYLVSTLGAVPLCGIWLFSLGSVPMCGMWLSAAGLIFNALFFISLALCTESFSTLPIILNLSFSILFSA